MKWKVAVALLPRVREAIASPTAYPNLFPNMRTVLSVHRRFRRLWSEPHKEAQVGIWINNPLGVAKRRRAAPLLLDLPNRLCPLQFPAATLQHYLPRCMMELLPRHRRRWPGAPRREQRRLLLHRPTITIMTPKGGHSRGISHAMWTKHTQ
ncbi:putative beta prime cop protein [Trypanosoma cruzi]|uniref:Putative beta prime cop protein n=1 Tax=Trypanosoma cruzi TaxID=5693 RepID=A0A2V2VTA4_TRYCR|nr:putative beta prime cop protein [Trypanosoma cruzi]